MAFYSDTHAPTTTGILTRIGGFFAGLAQAVLTARAAEARVHEMERLAAKSDADLAALGLRREDIARHVFRDILHI